MTQLLMYIPYITMVLPLHYMVSLSPLDVVLESTMCQMNGSGESQHLIAQSNTVKSQSNTVKSSGSHNELLLLAGGITNRSHHIHTQHKHTKQTKY